MLNSLKSQWIRPFSAKRTTRPRIVSKTISGFCNCFTCALHVDKSKSPLDTAKNLIELEAHPTHKIQSICKGAFGNQIQGDFVSEITEIFTFRCLREANPQ